MTEMYNPLVSIILVNYNGYKDTCDCIKSLIQLHYDNYKIFVIDNGSTMTPTETQIHFIKDNSCYIHLDNNLGFSGGNNKGIYEARKINSDFYLLLNNDTTVEPDFLDCLLAAYNDNSIGLLTGKICFYRDKNKIWYGGGCLNYDTAKVEHFGYNSEDNGDFNRDKNVTFATGCLWLIPKLIVEKIGLLSEEYFLYCEDTDYCYRLLNHGLKIRYIGKAKIYHKVSASAGKNSALQQYYITRNTLLLINKYSHRKKAALARYYMKLVRDILLRQGDPSSIIKAIKDYKENNFGKINA